MGFGSIALQARNTKRQNLAHELLEAEPPSAFTIGVRAGSLASVSAEDLPQTSRELDGAFASGTPLGEGSGAIAHESTLGLENFLDQG